MDTSTLISRKLDATERPKAMYRYCVTGTGLFPIDMLRYDSCWPYSSGDGLVMVSRETPGKARTVKLGSYGPPTEGRWQSFGWTVSKYGP